MPRRLPRLLLHISAAISALLFLTLSTLQLRSLWRSDSFFYDRSAPGPVTVPVYLDPSSPPPPGDAPGPVAYRLSTVHRLSAANFTGGLYLTYSRSAGFPAFLAPAPPLRHDSGPPRSLSQFLTLLSPYDPAVTRHVPGVTLVHDHDPVTSNRFISLTISTWLLLPATAILPALSTLLILRHRRTALRLQRGQCPRCGYDLRATPAQCPECGRIPPPPLS